MFKNTARKWGIVSQSFHWLIALLFVGMYLVAEQMEELAPQGDSFLGFGKWEMYGLHKATGVVILALVALRIVWRLSTKAPTEGEVGSPLQKKLAGLVHLALYGVMLGMPVSGYVMSMAGGHSISFYGLFTLPGFVGRNPELGNIAHTAHGVIWTVFIGLLVLHVGAALYHHIFLKDDVLRRMAPHGFGQK